MANKNRTDLKSYFVKNAIPTEGNFADLIDSQLNQAQDGVFKPDGEALSVIAAPGDQKRALRLYANYPASNPDWVISLNPAQDPANAATTSRPGFGITDGAGRPKLFIDAATGQIGVGTNAPQVALDVAGGARADTLLTGKVGIGIGTQAPGDILHVHNAATVGLFESTTTQAALRLVTSEGMSNHIELANRAGGHAAISVGTGGDALIVKKDGGVVVSAASGGVGDLTVENFLRFPNAVPKDKIVIWDGGTTDRFGIGLNSNNINLFYPTTARFSLRQNSCSGNEIFSVSSTGAARFYGQIIPKIGNDGSSGIYFPTDPGGGGGDAAFIRYYVESGETTKLLIGINNDPDDRLSLYQYGGERLTIYNGCVGINTITPTSTLHVNGSFTATSKYFSIDHPLDSKRSLIHSVLEGPEVAVFYRGEAVLVDGMCEIALPSYFEALTRKEHRTVLVTPKLSDGEETSALAASGVTDGRFIVRAIDPRNRKQRFFWEVKGVRADIGPLEVEPLKPDVPAPPQPPIPEDLAPGVAS